MENDYILSCISVKGKLIVHAYRLKVQADLDSCRTFCKKVEWYSAKGARSHLLHSGRSLKYTFIFYLTLTLLIGPVLGI